MEVDELVLLPRLPRVAVCGGTHGNELSGVYLVKELLKEVQEKKTDDEGPLSVQILLSNPRATQQCRRYIDTDLNRCFSLSTLNGPVSDAAPYEIILARELNALLGPKGSQGAVDLVCDLHNTTANMGLCFIAYSDKDWICLHIFQYLQDSLNTTEHSFKLSTGAPQGCVLSPVFFSVLTHHFSYKCNLVKFAADTTVTRQMPDMPMRFIHFNVSKKESYSLDSVGKHGFALEIGPQPHGVVRSNVYTVMKVCVQHILDWIHYFNSGSVFEGGFVDVFTMVKNIDYPRDSQTHNITAAIHPHLQDRDFCLLRPEDPLFQTFSGEELTYKGNEPLYPFFINECAYYEKGIALSLARKKRAMVPPIRAQTEVEKQSSEQIFTSEEEE